MGLCILRYQRKYSFKCRPYSYSVLSLFDFIDVRYTYNWLQPPKTVYGFDFPGYDGISLVHTQTLGSWDSTVQLILWSFRGGPQ